MILGTGMKDSHERILWILLFALSLVIFAASVILLFVT